MMDMNQPTLVGRRWVFADGTTLPVISGGSDVMAGAPPVSVPPPPSAPPAAPAPDPVPAAPAAPEPSTDPGTGDVGAPATAPPTTPGLSLDEIETSIQTMESAGDLPERTRTELSKFRHELARHRVEGAELKAAFENVPEPDRAAWLGLTGDFYSNPAQAFDTMMRTAAAMAGDRFGELAKSYLHGEDGSTAAPAAAPVAAGAPAPEPAPFDPADPKSISDYIATQVQEGLAGFQADQQTQARVAEQTKAIAAKLTELGYDPNPASVRVKALLLQAKEIGGDPLEGIAKAHEVFQGELRAQNEKYLQDKATGSGQPVPTNGQAAASGSNDDTLTREQRISRRLDDTFGPRQGLNG